MNNFWIYFNNFSFSVNNPLFMNNEFSFFIRNELFTERIIKLFVILTILFNCSIRFPIEFYNSIQFEIILIRSKITTSQLIIILQERTVEQREYPSKSKIFFFKFIHSTIHIWLDYNFVKKNPIQNWNIRNVYGAHFAFE